MSECNEYWAFPRLQYMDSKNFHITIYSLQYKPYTRNVREIWVEYKKKAKWHPYELTTTSRNFTIKFIGEASFAIDKFRRAL